MNSPFIKLTCLLIFSCSFAVAKSQDLTGIWRGSFYNVREVLMGGSRYRYEVQIDNKGKGIKGVTYSYQTTRFYGKATLVGMWTPGTQNLIIKEEKMEDLKIEGGGEGSERQQSRLLESPSREKCFRGEPIIFARSRPSVIVSVSALSFA